ncbi:phosphoglycerate dehydrogenase-like enzyme [Isoptericola jiangsuensis]|uniref:Phosphoglycerate dehydrogenase-like enzyme n=1 Tax=Isoptericola jiangsuensis TaxID=548579 RepID=A0A2A9EXE8_9MICO|nr:phosphoglycerate dehydrogenase [Isoptericola jiangsuensis]PFG43714.1 phosphoglycerate dehydrogenase-like enzyme [Isoptericola jiangsuensis]
MKILVPSNVPFDLTLDVDGVVVAPYVMRDPVPDEHADAEAIVTWANPAPLLRDAAERLTALRWVQTLSAGPDLALAAGFGPNVVVASGRSLHDATVAEHTLALLLASVRRLDRTLDAQRRHEWDRSLGREQARDEPAFTLHGAHVVLWGFGSIAVRLAPLLEALGARVTGVASTDGERHGYPVVAQERLAEVLPGTDVLVSLLPATPATRHALDASVLALLPPHARFVNVGRGSTVDEDALVAALRSGTLAGAALDVTDTEPLPADSPLWDAPHLILTPHVAGGRPQGAAAFVTEQVRRWLADGPAGLRNVVAR